MGILRFLSRSQTKTKHSRLRHTSPNLTPVPPAVLQKRQTERKETQKAPTSTQWTRPLLPLDWLKKTANDLTVFFFPFWGLFEIFLGEKCGKGGRTIRASLLPVGEGCRGRWALSWE